MKLKLIKEYLVLDSCGIKHEFDRYDSAFKYLLEIKYLGDYDALLVIVSNKSSVLNDDISDYKILESSDLLELEGIAYQYNIYRTSNRKQTEEVIKFLEEFDDDYSLQGVE